MSNYEFSADDPARRMAHVRRVIAEQNAKMPAVDSQGRVIPADDTKPNIIDLGGAA